MGQRHQIYIRIENPLKKVEEPFLFDSDGEKMKEAEILYGKGKYSVIPFHHQWLFGTSAVGMLVKIMTEVHKAKGTRHPFSPDLDNLPYETSFRSDNLAGFGLIEFIQALITITDFEVSEIGGRFGVERLIYIGDEHYDKETKKKSNYSHQKSCDCGDNNDGVMIIDVPSKKYCFMNIFEQDTSRDCRASVYSLPQLTPVSALDYQKAYYPTTKRTISDYQVDRAGGIEEALKEHREMAEAIKEIVKDFDVLSLAEVKKMFPKTYKDHKKYMESKGKKCLV